MLGLKAHLIDSHLLVPKSKSFAKVKVKDKGHIYQRMAVWGALVFHKHIMFQSFQMPFHIDVLKTLVPKSKSFAKVKVKVLNFRCGEKNKPF